MDNTDSQVQKEYSEHVRGVATFILLHQKDPPTDAQKVATLYHRDLATVVADVDAIIQRELHKKGGAFEDMSETK